MAKVVKDEDGRNRRAHLRYRDPESTVIDLFTKDKDVSSQTFKALIVNESFKGFAVVYVGDGNIKKRRHHLLARNSQLTNFLPSDS